MYYYGTSAIDDIHYVNTVLNALKSVHVITLF